MVVTPEMSRAQDTRYVLLHYCHWFDSSTV